MSTLLEQASLVLIPSGYKEDVVYSQIPTSGAGDLSFTRASNGTRVNSAGLVEVCPWNLLQQSETFENSAWTKDASTISSNAINAPNGTLTADLLIPSTTSATDHRIRQSLPNSVGNFNYSVYVKSGGYNWVKLRSDTNWANVNLSNGAIGFTSGVTPTVEILSDGWYRISFSVVNVSGGFAYVYPMNVNENSIDPSAWAGNGTSGVYLWGAQLNIGSTAKPYFPTTDRINVPRLTYQNGGGGCPSLLLEPQRTNSILYSQDFDNAYWSKQSGAIVTANSAISPDGTQNADTINLVSGSTISRVEKGGISLSANTYLTFSVYLKNISLTSGQTFQLRFETLGFDLRGTIDLFNKTNTVSITGGTGTGYVSGTQSASISELSDGWLRCNITVQVGSLVVGTGTFYLITNVDANRSFYAWGIQYEAGAYPTTYIPTTSASATRVADVAQKTSISSLIGQTEGTIFLDTKYLASATASGRWFNVFGTINNIGLALNGVNSVRTIINGLSDTINTSPKTDLGVKIAFAYNAMGVVLFINGIEYALTLGGTQTMTSLDSILFDASVNPQFQQGEVNSFILFKTRLTNAELASLTTL